MVIRHKIDVLNVNKTEKLAENKIKSEAEKTKIYNNRMEVKGETTTKQKRKRMEQRKVRKHMYI